MNKKELVEYSLLVGVVCLLGLSFLFFLRFLNLYQTRNYASFKVGNERFKMKVPENYGVSGGGGGIGYVYFSPKVDQESSFEITVQDMEGEQIMNRLVDRDLTKDSVKEQFFLDTKDVILSRTFEKYFVDREEVEGLKYEIIEVHSAPALEFSFQSADTYYYFYKVFNGSSLLTGMYMVDSKDLYETEIVSVKQSLREIVFF